MSNPRPKGWIGVDLDGTLADYGVWVGPEHIGAPIPLMVERVKKWIAEGQPVRIFTARVCQWKDGSKDIPAVRSAIEKWCLEHLGAIIPITCTKDWEMVELWDDRAIQVIKNTGKRADGND